MRALLQDLYYTLRQLRKSLGFTLTAVLTLAVGIGGVTAVFSIVEAVMLRPLPFQDSGRLISLYERFEQDSHELRMSAPDVLTFQRESEVFSGVGGFIASAYELTGAGAPFKARAERVTSSVFPLLGIEPLLGRVFTQQEDNTASAVTVISYALWKERFHHANVLGTTIDLDRRPYTIIGVMPRSFEFPLDAGRLSQRDLWVPMSFTPVEKKSEGNNFDYSAIARLKAGITTAQAQQDVDRIVKEIQAQNGAGSGLKLHAYFLPLREAVIHNARPLLGILLGAVALILLIACVNLANLLLVRAAGRRREFGCAARANRSRRCPTQAHSRPVSWSTSTLLDRVSTRPCAIHTSPIACPKPRPARSLVSCGTLPQCTVLLRDPPVCLETGRYRSMEGSAQLPAGFSSRWDRLTRRCSNIRWRSVLQLGIGLRGWILANCPWQSFPERDSLRRASLPRVFGLRCRYSFRTI
jgi:hypothetical protein